jgi:hypothetical protein
MAKFTEEQAIEFIYNGTTEWLIPENLIEGTYLTVDYSISYPSLHVDTTIAELITFMQTQDL